MRPIARCLSHALLLFAVLALFGCTELQDLRIIKDAQDRRIEELQAQIERLSADSISNARDLQNQLDASQDLLEKTRDSLRKAQTLRTQRENVLEREKRDADSTLAAKETELTRAMQTASDLANEIDQKNTEIEALRVKEADLATAQADLAQQATVVKNLEDKVSWLERESEEAKSAIGENEVNLASREARISELESQLATETQRADLQEKNVANLATQIENLQTALREAETAQGAEDEKIGFEKEALRLQAQIQDMLQGKEVLDADIENMLAQLTVSFKPLVDAGFATVGHDARGGVVGLSAKYLFEQGAISLDVQALQTLDRIGAIVAEYPDKYVEVQGHTDAQRVEKLPFADNWSLASARADAVVRYLANDTEIDAKKIKSSSCAQYRPTESGKLLRRVEIIVGTRP